MVIPSVVMAGDGDLFADVQNVLIRREWLPHASAWLTLPFMKL